jgi:hypothetical protein
MIARTELNELSDTHGQLVSASNDDDDDDDDDDDNDDGGGGDLGSNHADDDLIQHNLNESQNSSTGNINRLPSRLLQGVNCSRY